MRDFQARLSLLLVSHKPGFYRLSATALAYSLVATGGRSIRPEYWARMKPAGKRSDSANRYPAAGRCIWGDFLCAVGSIGKSPSAQFDRHTPHLHAHRQPVERQDAAAHHRSSPFADHSAAMEPGRRADQVY